MRTFTIAAAVGAALAATTAAAQPAARTTYQDGEGRSWEAIPSETGILLSTRGAHIYLRRGCKAASARWGLGRWEWANGGFVVIFGETRIGFPRQEIDAPERESCRA